MFSELLKPSRSLFLGLVIASFSLEAVANNNNLNLESVVMEREGDSFTLSDSSATDSGFFDGVNFSSDSFHGSLPDGVATEEDLLDEVHGPDERTRIFDTTSFPNRTIGRFGLGCTGTLVGPRVVLTAAHCVFNLKKKEWIKDLDFSPGQNGNTKPYGTVKWSRVVVNKAYTEKGKTEWDIAVVILDTPVGNQLGWMAYSYDEGLKSLSMNINGYPGDKPLGTMWHAFCPAQSIQAELFTYLCDTKPGSSGSAIYRFLAATKERKIFGVHTNGFASHNHGTRITKAKFEKLQAWKAQNP